MHCTAYKASELVECICQVSGLRDETVGSERTFKFVALLTYLRFLMASMAASLAAMLAGLPERYNPCVSHTKQNVWVRRVRMPSFRAWGQGCEE